MRQNTIVEICNSHGNRPDALIEILHGVQHVCGHLSDDNLIEIAHALNISRADIYGVVSFYDDFRRKPPSGPCIKICRAEACQAVGGETLAKYVKEAGVETHDVYCLGNCALGPAIMIDDRLYGRVDGARFDALLKRSTS
jgi:formate dehydrogenase subunit gamma